MLGKHLDYLDGWRGLAIGFLLVGHFFPAPGINLGSVGVSLFFVLSGWLMTRLLFIEHTPISTFYRRRVSRIFPVHLVFIGAVVALSALFRRPMDWTEIAAAALFLTNYFPELDNPTLPFGHIWSLCVEEHSYIVLSAVAVAARRGWVEPKRALAVLTVACSLFAIWYWMRYSGRELVFAKWNQSEVAAYGILLSGLLLLHFHQQGIPRVHPLVCPALMVLGIALHWWSVPDPVRTLCGVGAFALAVNLLPSAPRALHAVMSVRLLRQLGLWSFSLYMWQQPFYVHAHRGEMPMMLAVLAALAAGIASFYLIERPVRQYLNRVWTGQDHNRTASLKLRS
jgi:peptidoglycan/LPS O-acetylase OafA/YrhL